MEPQISFNQVVSRGCGIDVHQKVVVATIGGEGLKKATREFGTFTRSLTELKDWLLENGVTHVAMESTGIYWKPVYHVLEPTTLKVWIVNARHIKYVPGHKTDKQDSAWICKLLLAGLLKPSYIPAKEQRECRQKKKWKNNPREQTGQSGNNGGRVGGNKDQKHILLSQISPGGSKKRQKESLDSSRTFDPEVCLSCDKWDGGV